VIPYLCSTEEEQKKMLAEIGAASLEDLFHSIPRELMTHTFPVLPPALREYELLREIRNIAGRNGISPKSVSFMGGGVYEHFIPSIVPALAGRAEFVTSYTPYHPEASQGNLQVFFEYQSLITRLLEMDISNASMYDVATALAEGVIMAAGQMSGRKRCLVAETMHPFYRDVLATYMKNFDLELVILKSTGGIVPLASLEKELDDQTVCAVYQHPNFLGCLENMNAASERIHASGALFLSVVDPISLGLLSPPGQYHADIAVAEGQCLGMPPYFGGETLGIFTCKKEFMRKMPGRLVGLTTDTRGKRGFVLTLQTREQHIRREKATSNICTNHALNAIKATIYLSAMGPSGMKEIAQTCYANAQYALSQIKQLGKYHIPFEGPVFKEFAVKARNGNVPELIQALAPKGFLVGPDLGAFLPEWKNCFLICTTEIRNRQEIDELVKALNALS